MRYSVPNHWKIIRGNFLCNHSNGDLFMCEDNIIFICKDIMFSCEAYLVFLWCLYNNIKLILIIVFNLFNYTVSFNAHHLMLISSKVTPAAL